MSPGRYIAIAGNMGSGKSSLVEFLCRHFKIKPLFEPNDTNPYLADFYRDMRRWAFHSQMHFLSQKFKMHHQSLNDCPQTVVQDRSIFEDAEIFAKNCHRQGLMSDRDYKIYQNFYRSILKSIRPPDLLIYLKCGLPTIKKRIARRGRGMEQKIPDGYLRRLSVLYQEWIRRYKLSAVMVCRTDKLDYLSDFVHRGDLLQKIARHL